MKKRTFLRNALCLTATAFAMRMISMVYRIYLTGKIGAEGVGLYQLIDSVFVFAITVSTAGISLSVTRILSDLSSGGHPKAIKSCMRKCILFCLALSTAAAVILYVVSPYLGSYLVGDSRVILPLRLLAPGLPFMAVCSCMKGYFLSMRTVWKSSVSELLEQLVTISVSVMLFVFAAPDTVEGCCCAIVVGATVGEFSSCCSAYLLYRSQIRKARHPEKSTHILHRFCRIVLPITVSSTLRSGLSVVENLLIPVGFRKNGATAASALAEYGILNGMVLPILFFPTTPLTSFGSLLVPELTEALTQKQYDVIRSLCSRAIRTTLLYAMVVAAFCFCFADHLGLALYHSDEAARSIRILSPLIPLWYLDIVVDHLLKGLDQQLASLRYNFTDAMLRVALVLFLIPYFGTKGYLCILFCSTIYNVSLSFHRLIKTTVVDLSLLRSVGLPLLSGTVAVSCTRLLLSVLPDGVPSVVLLSLGLLLSLALYIVLLYLSGSVRREDLLWAKTMVK